LTADEFRQAREALGLKGLDFARIFHVTDRTVRAWESDTPTKWRIPFATAMLIKLAVKFPQVRRELGIVAKKAANKGQSAAP
jgi:DNA-binding XRE family transcriptional regulator